MDSARVNVLYRPGMKVVGDLFDITLLDNNRVPLYVADLAGHGVATAMLSVLFKQFMPLLDAAGDARSPAEVFHRVNKRMTNDGRIKGLFLTAGYVLVNLGTGELQAASAGHTPILSRRANGDKVLLERTGPALGLTANAIFAERHLYIQPNDRLMLYTNGLIDGLDVGDDDELMKVLIPFVAGE